MKDYIKHALRTECDYGPATLRIIKDPNLVRLLHAALLLSTEANEILNNLKAHIYYGKPLDLTNIDEEGGDIFWALAILADYRGYKSFFKLMHKNIAKLKARYPDKFTEEAAQVRDLELERAVLEGKPFSGWRVLHETQSPAADYRQDTVQYWKDGKCLLERVARLARRALHEDMAVAVEQLKSEMTTWLQNEELI